MHPGQLPSCEQSIRGTVRGSLLSPAPDVLYRGARSRVSRRVGRVQQHPQLLRYQRCRADRLERCGPTSAREVETKCKESARAGEGEAPQPGGDGTCFIPPSVPGASRWVSGDQWLRLGSNCPRTTARTPGWASL